MRACRRFEPADFTYMGDESVMRPSCGKSSGSVARDARCLSGAGSARDLQGMSTEEASEVLHVKTRTLKSRLHRGRTFCASLQEFAGGLTPAGRNLTFNLRG